MKYEYKCVPTLNVLDNEMNNLGNLGWELVCHNYHHHLYIFKREVKEAKK